MSLPQLLLHVNLKRICHEITRDFVVMRAVVQDNYKNTDNLLYNVSMFVCGMCYIYG